MSRISLSDHHGGFWILDRWQVRARGDNCTSEIHMERNDEQFRTRNMKFSPTLTTTVRSKRSCKHFPLGCAAVCMVHIAITRHAGHTASTTYLFVREVKLVYDNGVDMVVRQQIIWTRQPKTVSEVAVTTMTWCTSPCSTNWKQPYHQIDDNTLLKKF